jgi:SHAQKYF class myb-like DNA-binding protein
MGVGGTKKKNKKNKIKQGRWTDEEHARFVEALRLFGKDWNKVQEHISTRTSA